MDDWIPPLLAALALPQYGLSTVFVIAFVSATLLPMGSEPAVFGLVKLNPDLFWPAVLVGDRGQHAGRRAHLVDGLRRRARLRTGDEESRAPRIRRRCAGSNGSARRRACCRGCRSSATRLCAVAGWLRLPFWPCVAYMAIGKFARYVTMTALLLWVFPGTFTW